MQSIDETAVLNINIRVMYTCFGALMHAATCVGSPSGTLKGVACTGGTEAGLLRGSLSVIW